MPVSLKVLSEIKKKAGLYEAAKESAKERITTNVKVLVDKLKAVEKELLDRVDAEFSENIFSALLESIDAGHSHTDEEINDILSGEIPSGLASADESFRVLLSDIEKLGAWNKEGKLSPFRFIPQNLKCTETTSTTATLSWDKVARDCFYEIELVPVSSVLPKSVYHSDKPESTIRGLKPETEYCVCVRTIVEHVSNKQCIWSDPITIQTKYVFSEHCVWKECPGYVEEKRKYTVDEENPRIATKVGNVGDCIITGNTPIPPNTVTSWSIKVLKSRDNDGGIIIGVVPSDINQNGNDERGWCFDCYDSTLRSGPPRNYNGKEYGPRKEDGEYVHTGDSIGVVMDTAKGELSFALNGVNLGVAYEEIPLDKPLVPCVVLGYEGDSVELVF